MSVEVKLTCPLGSRCEEAKDGAIHRCHWYVPVRGKNMNTGEEIDDWRCAMNWMPMLLIENSGMQRHTGAAVESFRNAMIEGNARIQHAMQAAIEKKDVPTIREIN